MKGFMFMTGAFILLGFVYLHAVERQEKALLNTQRRKAQRLLKGITPT